MFGKKGTGQRNAAVEGSKQANVSSESREKGENRSDLPNAGQSMIENNIPLLIVPQKSNLPARTERIGYRPSLTNDHRIPPRFDNDDPERRTTCTTLLHQPYHAHDLKPILLIPIQKIQTGTMLEAALPRRGHLDTPLLQDGPAGTGAQRRQHPRRLESELPKDLGTRRRRGGRRFGRRSARQRRRVRA